MTSIKKFVFPFPFPSPPSHQVCKMSIRARSSPIWVVSRYWRRQFTLYQ